MKRRLADRLTEVACYVGLGFLVALIVVLSVRDCSARRDCESKGGRIDYYNCQLTLECTERTNGDGTVAYKTCRPIQRCEWRCVGLPAESP